MCMEHKEVEKLNCEFCQGYGAIMMTRWELRNLDKKKGKKFVDCPECNGTGMGLK